MEEHVLGGTREPPGDKAPYESRFYSEFAGILQVEISNGYPMYVYLLPLLL